MSHTPLIVVLDNDEPFIEMISEFLQDEGYEALPIRKSVDAFEVIKNRNPQLVIIELHIINPEVGLTILNKMRLDPQTTHIPVVIASTATDYIERNEAHLKSKRCDILMKPFELEELLSIVHKFIAAPKAYSFNS